MTDLFESPLVTSIMLLSGEAYTAEALAAQVPHGINWRVIHRGLSASGFAPRTVPGSRPTAFVADALLIHALAEIGLSAVLI